MWESHVLSERYRRPGHRRWHSQSHGRSFLVQVRFVEQQPGLRYVGCQRYWQEFLYGSLGRVRVEAIPAGGDGRQDQRRGC